MRLFVLSFIAAELLLICGCARFPWSKSVRSPTVTVSPRGQISTTGDAAQAAQVKQTTTDTSITLKAGDFITWNPTTNEYKISLSSPSTLATHATGTEVKGPVAFTPPAPPTPTENAKGEVTKLMYLALAAGSMAFMFGLVEGWRLVMTGGGVVIAGALCGIYFSDHPTMTLVLLVIGATLFLTGPTLWHTALKYLQPGTVTATATATVATTPKA